MLVGAGVWLLKPSHPEKGVGSGVTKPVVEPSNQLKELQSLYNRSVITKREDLEAVMLATGALQLLVDQQAYLKLAELRKAGRLTLTKVSKADMQNILRLGGQLGSIESNLGYVDAFTAQIKFPDGYKYIISINEEVFKDPTKFFFVLVHELIGHVVSTEQQGYLPSLVAEEIRAYTREVSLEEEAMRKLPQILQLINSDPNPQNRAWLLAAFNREKIQDLKTKALLRVKEYQRDLNPQNPSKAMVAVDRNFGLLAAEDRAMIVEMIVAVILIIAAIKNYRTVDLSKQVNILIKRLKNPAILEQERIQVLNNMKSLRQSSIPYRYLLSEEIMTKLNDVLIALLKDANLDLRQAVLGALSKSGNFHTIRQLIYDLPEEESLKPEIIRTMGNIAFFEIFVNYASEFGHYDESSAMDRFVRTLPMSERSILIDALIEYVNKKNSSERRFNRILLLVQGLGSRHTIGPLEKLKARLAAEKSEVASLEIGFIEKTLRKIQGDEAMTGGIDLTSDKALQVQNSGEELKFHLDPAMLAQLQNAPGFVPVIINIQPMTDLRQFLGIA